MKTPRTNKIVVLAATNRRVYAKMCKKESTVYAWVERTFLKEKEKAKIKDGLTAVGLSECVRHGDLFEYHVVYDQPTTK